VPFVALRDDEQAGRVYIGDYDDPRQALAGATLICPDCRMPMIVKQGAVVCHHFAHKAGDKKPCSPPHPATCAPNDDAGIAGTIHTRPRGRRAATRPHGSTAAAALARGAATPVQRRPHCVPLATGRASPRRQGALVLSDEQYANDVTTRRADGESWAGLARAYGMTQTTLMAAYARQTAAKRQEQTQ
jgi:hypothetical protein